MKWALFGISAEGPDMTALGNDTADASSLLLAISSSERKLNLDRCLGVELGELTTEPADE